MLSSPTLLTDNIGAQALSQNTVFHAHIKHIEIDYYFLRDQVVHGALHIEHVSSADQIVDSLTKAFPSTSFLFLRHKLMVVSLPFV